MSKPLPLALLAFASAALGAAGFLADRTRMANVPLRGDELEAPLPGTTLTCDPGDIEGRLALGRIHLERQQHAEAEACFRAVLAERPDDAAALSALGACFIATGRPEAAIEPLDRAVTLQPTREAAWRLRQALVKTGQTGRAHDALALFLSLDRGPEVN